jgi:hypothetical protein
VLRHGLIVFFLNKFLLHPTTLSLKAGVVGSIIQRADLTKKIMQQIHYDTMKHFLAHPDHFHMTTTGSILSTGMHLKWQWLAFQRCFDFGWLST